MHYNIHMEDSVVKLYIEITRKEVMDIINHFHNLTMRINHRIISRDELFRCDNIDASLRILNRRQFQTSYSTGLAEFIIKIGRNRIHFFQNEVEKVLLCTIHMEHINQAQASIGFFTNSGKPPHKPRGFGEFSDPNFSNIKYEILAIDLVNKKR